MKSKKTRRFFKWFIFIIYIAALVYFMFFAEILGRTDVGKTYRYNLVLFKEIKRFVNHFSQLGIEAVLANVAGNVLAFIPFGYCLPMVTEHKMKFISVTLYTFNLSLCIELVQLISKVGSFDVDDLLLNTFGGILGYICFCIVKAIWKKKKKRRS